MKLEEILPEIRKGRRCNNRCNKEWFTPMELILDDSWELEPPLKRELSKEDIERAFNKASSRTNMPNIFMDEFMRELGFK